MFRIPQPIDGASLDPKTTLDIAPSLVVLHEPSAYFLPLIASDPDSCVPFPIPYVTDAGLHAGKRFKATLGRSHHI